MYMCTSFRGAELGKMGAVLDMCVNISYNMMDKLRKNMK